MQQWASVECWRPGRKRRDFAQRDKPAQVARAYGGSRGHRAWMGVVVLMGHLLMQTIDQISKYIKDHGSQVFLYQ